MTSKNSLITFLVLIIIALTGFLAYSLGTGNLTLPSIISPRQSCTEEAMLCPDGITTVVRIPPSCDFAPCPSYAPTSVPTTPPPSTPSPSSTPSASIPAGWLTYTSQEYGFEISYPFSYQALDDSNNLYGWPNGIVLFYDGGQSYDLAIEHWSSVTDYESKYPNASNLTVHQVGNYYLTLLNTNFEPEVDNIIATFRTLSP